MTYPLTYSTLGRSGRLGSELWQITSTIGLSKKFSHKYTHATLPKWKYQKYFSFPEHYFSGAQGKNAWNEATWLDPKHRRYLQDLSCIESVKNDVKQWLQPSNYARKRLDRLVEQYRPFDATAIHVRRGDYEHVWQGVNLLDKSYYMSIWPKGRILIFSDDPKWCKENLPAENAQIVHHEPWLDLMIMSQCRAHIISNSTFAWWGAWSSNSREVKYPSPWLKDIDLDIFEPWWKPIHR